MIVDRAILIVDDKLTSNERRLETTVNQRLRNTSSAVTVFSDCADAVRDAASAAVIFLHHGNDGWQSFARDCCKGKDLILVSSAPDEGRVEEISKLLVPNAPPRLFGSSVVTTEDWENLRWREAVEAWRQGESFPIQYLAPRSTEVLTALSILCQGYLAAHAEIGDDGIARISGESEIGDALAAMGWVKFWDSLSPDQRRQCASTLLQNRPMSEKTEWWMAVFPEGLSEMSIRTEWRNSGRGEIRNVLELANALVPGATVAPTIVSNAYRSLCEQLH